MIGEVIGNYRVVAELGKGGMGVVYRAEHVQLGRPAALKMLLPQFSSDQNIVQRFFNEARAASAIDHPGIVEIYDFGTHTDGRAYIVMALLRGESLESRLGAGPLSPVDGATILAQVVAALGAAHQRGIVHRDLKPDNIFLVPNELVPGGIQVKLLDFGIAKLADEKQAGFKTQTGALMGTPAYMSPEQCMGSPNLDHRTDLYSIGCILFHVLTGRPPFTSEHGTGMMIAAHIRDAAPDPRSINPNVPAALAAVILRCLEKEPAARYQTAAELRNALVAAGANAPLSRPPGAEQYAPTMAPTQQYGAQPSSYGANPQAAYASAVGPSPTTHSQSAAQVMSQAPVARTKSRAPVWIGVGVLLAGLGAVAVVVAAKHDDKPAAVASEPGSAAVATGEPGSQPGAAVKGAELGSAAAVPGSPPNPDLPGPTPVPPQPDKLAITGDKKPVDKANDCPPGQAKTADTKGQCCWPEQAWSSSKKRCVGKAKCPTGTAAKGETCIAVAVPVDPKHDAVSTSPGNAPTFRLGSTSYAPGDKIAIIFASPVTSTPNNRAWITIIEAGKPPSAYGTWTYLDDGAKTAALEAPRVGGAYEVRLHTDYPAKSFNVVRSVAVTISSPDQPVDIATDAAVTPIGKQRFRLASTTIIAGGDAQLSFPMPMVAAKGEQFWVTVVESSKGDNEYGHYEYVPAAARGMKIKVPTTPGTYDVRLHANYPTKSTNPVHRVKIRVETGP